MLREIFQLVVLIAIKPTLRIRATMTVAANSSRVTVFYRRKYKQKVNKKKKDNCVGVKSEITLEPAVSDKVRKVD